MWVRVASTCPDLAVPRGTGEGMCSLVDITSDMNTSWIAWVLPPHPQKNCANTHQTTKAEFLGGGRHYLNVWGGKKKSRTLGQLMRRRPTDDSWEKKNWDGFQKLQWDKTPRNLWGDLSGCLSPVRAHSGTDGRWKGFEPGSSPDPWIRVKENLKPAHNCGTPSLWGCSLILRNVFWR